MGMPLCGATVVVVVALLLLAAAVRAHEQPHDTASQLKLMHDIFDGKGDDPFLKLSLADLKQDWSAPIGRGRMRFQSALAKGFSDTIFVNVILVGLEGDIAEHVRVAKADLQALLAHEPLLAQPFHTFDGKPLNVNGSVHFHVDAAPKGGLAVRVRDAIGALLQSHTTFQHLPVAAMDDLVRAHYEQSKSTVPTLYLVNGGRRHVGYAWRTGARGCSTPHFAGRHHNYAWLDLNAGPLEWGPVTSGEGIVSSHAVPFIEDEAAFADARVRSAFVAALGGYAVRTTQRLLSTSITRFPFVGMRTGAAVQFVLIADSRAGLAAAEQQVATMQKVLEEDAPGVRVASVSIELHRSVYALTALEHARKYHTSTHGGGGGALADALKRHAYLDSAELRQWMLRFLPDMEVPTAPTTLPVLVFHTSSADDFLMLDRTHLAVAFDDAVLAVTTDHGAQVAHDFFCNSDRDTHLQVSQGSARPLLAAIMDSLYGVAPTHLRYDVQHRRVAADYIWSLADSVSGVFSQATHNARFIRAQVPRNVALAALASMAIEVGELAAPALYDADKPLSSAATAAEYELVCQRWNLWEWKAREAEWLMSGQDYSGALKFVTSMRHDVRAIRNVLRDVGRRVSSRLVCLDSSVLEWAAADYAALVFVAVSLAGSAALLWSGYRKWRGKAKKSANKWARLPDVGNELMH